MIDHFSKALQALVVIAAVWFIYAFLGVALQSMAHPYALEWMEGQMMEVIGRVIDGKPIYTEPNIEYVPFIYPPMYFYISALSAKILGLEFFAARLVSFLSTLVIFGLIYSWVRKEGGARIHGLIGVGLYAATYELSSRWFDIARIDSLFLAFLLGAIYVFYFFQHWRGSILAGILFFAAFFTKQNTAVIAVVILTAGFFLNKTHALRTAALFISLSCIAIIMMDVASDAWFSYYIFELPAAHSIDSKFYAKFWNQDLIPNLWPLMILSGFAWWDLYKKDPRKAFFYLALAGGLIASSYAGRLHRFGWTNVLMTAHLALALCTTLALVEWKRMGCQVRMVSAWVLILMQLLTLIYDPHELVPGKVVVAEGDAFLAQVGALKGDVFISDIQFIQQRVGKKSYGYGMAAVDVLVSGKTSRDYAKQSLDREIREAIQSQQFSAVITRKSFANLQEYYAPDANIMYINRQVSGATMNRNQRIWLPIPGAKKLQSTAPAISSSKNSTTKKATK